MNPNKPFFTIAIPTYNRVDFLKRALESALNQTYPNLEIIVLDNASTDGTKEYLDAVKALDSRVKAYFNKENVGLVRNFQRITNKIVSGKYLNVLSDDDYLASDFVATAVASLEQDPMINIWYCRARYSDRSNILLFDAEIAPAIENGYVFVKEWLSGVRMPILCSVVFRFSVFEKMGGFACNAESNDIAVILRCAYSGVVHYDKRILSHYILDSHNTTSLMDHAKWQKSTQTLHNYVQAAINFPERYWACFFVRSLFFSVAHIRVVDFIQTYKMYCKTYGVWTFVYSLRYIHHLVLRPIIRRGRCFKQLRWLMHKVRSIL